jgi:hypothetical protein
LWNLVRRNLKPKIGNPKTISNRMNRDVMGYDPIPIEEYRGFNNKSTLFFTRFFS